MPRRDDHGFVNRHRRAPALATAARRQPPDITASGGVELLLDKDEESSTGTLSRSPYIWLAPCSAPTSVRHPLG
jgi:hypothetical protein